MTVTSTTNRATLAGNGVATAIPTGFIFFDNSSLVVTSVVDSTGAETTLAIGTDYTITGGSGEDGTVTMNTAPASGITIVVEREEPFTQTDAFAFSGKLSADVIESRYDKIVMMIQQIVDQSGFFLNASQTAFNALSKKISSLAPGTAGTDAVNKDQLDAVVAAAGNVPTPDNPGEDNYLLGASGGVADWVAPVTTRGNLTTFRGADTTTDAGKTQVAGDEGRLQLFDPGASNRTYALLAAATAGAGFTVGVRKSTDDAGDVIIDPNGSETIDGLTTFNLVQKGDTLTIMSDGSNWQILEARVYPIITRYASGSGTHTYTTGRNYAQWQITGGGGAGGFAGTTAAGQNSSGGGGGAGETFIGQAAIPGASSAYSVGAGGVGDTSTVTIDGTASSVTGVATAEEGKGGTRGTGTTGEQNTDGGDVSDNGTDTLTFDWSVRYRGGAGTGGGVISGRRQVTGTGGSSFFGGGGVAGNVGAGSAGQAPGSGGGGSTQDASASAIAGGNGASGFIEIIETYR